MAKIIKKRKKDQNKSFIETLAVSLEKEWRSLYGDVLYTSTHYGIEGEPHYSIRVYTNDQTIADKLPKEVEGFTIEVRSIPKAS
jgi:hypothetical protein